MNPVKQKVLQLTSADIDPITFCSLGAGLYHSLEKWVNENSLKASKSNANIFA